MKALAERFSGFRFPWSSDQVAEIRMLPEPVFRCAKPTASTIDGALFVFVEATRNPEILLVLEAETENQGKSEPTWKFHIAPLSANGLFLKLDGIEVWRWEQLINTSSAKPNDPYRIRFSSAEDEIKSR